ncbi:MAG TPA: hypothetical protein VF916_14655, partial [Ktedonobacterales bacterium]
MPAYTGMAPAYAPPGAGPWTTTHVPVPQDGQHRLHFAIFHDGNPGHLWRGELGSMLGDAVLSVGVIMWLVRLTYSPTDVALALVALGLPALLAGPLGATLTRVDEPARPFKLIGRLRIVFAAALIAMHFLTILPVLYMLLFGVALLGRLRASLRVAAMRACLAPGEPEHLAASMHFAAVVVAVIGPLVASLLYILNGERILLVSIGAAVFFLLGSSSDALVDALPAEQRAFLLAEPEPELADDEDLDPQDEDATSDDPELALERREAALPEWQQWGPGRIGEAVADISDGLRLIGSNAGSLGAIRALATLALMGGGVALLEVFYITDHFFLPTFYLGALLAAEGAGIAVGATLWSDLGRGQSGTVAWVGGMLATGALLIGLSLVGTIMVALFVAVGLGVANALAVEGARQALRAGFDGVERRALAAAETMIAAVCGIAGVGIFLLMHLGYSIGHSTGRRGAGRLTILYPFSVTQLFLAAGLGLIVAGIVFGFLRQFGGTLDRQRARRRAAAAARREDRMRLPSLDEEDEVDESGYYPAAGSEWEEDEDAADD